MHSLGQYMYVWFIIHNFTNTQVLLPNYLIAVILVRWGNFVLEIKTKNFVANFYSVTKDMA